jgi:sugar O-acyltransferase (sialic acid O-acetyltransferase NeuD family)
MSKPPEEIYVLGAGGHGKVAVRAAQSSGIRVVGVFDDDASSVGRLLCGVPILGPICEITKHPTRPTLIAIGDNNCRLALANDLDLPWATVVHPAAMIDATARLGAGVLVLAGAIVQVDAQIGDHVIVNDNAIVEHECHVAAGAHLSCGACVTGGARIGTGVLIGANAVVLPKIRVADYARVGAGAVVTKTVPPGATVVGSPARILKQTPHSSVTDLSSSTIPAQPRKRIYLSPPHMASRERELLLDAFDSNWIAPLGPHVDAFEREFADQIGAKHAVALSSGTAALHLALLAVGVQPGDCVVTSTLTFAATPNAIRYAGAEPVFIDSEPRSWNLDPNLLADELRDSAARGCLPAAVIAVDVFGQCADYHAINDACRRYEIPLIEDAAESLGAHYHGRPAGTLADVGCFSFNGNKIITTSGGGMLVTERADWAARVRHLATQARLPGPHYEHDEVGHNYRLSNLLAAIGRGQLSALDARVSKRRENFHAYLHGLSDLPGISFMPEFAGSSSNRWLTCVLFDAERFRASADEVRRALEAENIEARHIWKPMHLQPVYSACRVRGGRVAEDIFQRGLCLPSGSNLTDADISRVVDTIRSCAGATQLRRAG